MKSFLLQWKLKFLLAMLQSLLPQEEAVIFVVSTTGQGDAPDSMKVTYKGLLYTPFY